VVSAYEFPLDFIADVHGIMLNGSALYMETHSLIAQDHTKERFFVSQRGSFGGSLATVNTTTFFYANHTQKEYLLTDVVVNGKSVETCTIKSATNLYDPFSSDLSGLADLGGPILVNGVECRHLSGNFCEAPDRCMHAELYVGFTSAIPVRLEYPSFPTSAGPYSMSMDFSNVRVGPPPAYLFYPPFGVTCTSSKILNYALSPSPVETWCGNIKPGTSMYNYCLNCQTLSCFEFCGACP
jgi:hypothetical protein